LSLRSPAKDSGLIAFAGAEISIFGVGISGWVEGIASKTSGISVLGWLSRD
jgi:hypothetical protein